MASTHENSTDNTLNTHLNSSDIQAMPSTPNDPSTLETPRGRLKRRRILSHSPTRASSPSRGHDRASGSRHRHHYRKHHRASSSPSVQRSASPTPYGAAKKSRRRRSDAEPDHTLRGRARNRSGSRSRSPILEGEEVEREVRRRSQPPSRGWVERDGREAVDGEDGGLRRQRSFPNLYKDGRGRGRQDSGAHEGEAEAETEAEDMQGMKRSALAVQEM